MVRFYTWSEKYTCPFYTKVKKRDSQKLGIKYAQNGRHGFDLHETQKVDIGLVYKADLVRFILRTKCKVTTGK